MVKDRFIAAIDRLSWTCDERGGPPTTREEVEWLYERCHNMYPKVVVELGTGLGYSTRALGFAALACGANMTSVDNYSWGVGHQKVVEDVDAIGLPITFIHGDSLTVPVPNDIDFLFIDTSHEFEQTLAELNRYSKLMSPPGEMYLHDVLQGPPYGPAERAAIKTFLEQATSWLYEVVLESLNGIGRLYR